MAYTNIDDPTIYFNTKLTNGNSSTQAITGLGFQPDWIWGKQRTGTQKHQLLDAIRGANNILVSSDTAANLADSNILNSFDVDGFTLGSQDQLNDTGATYAFWCWKANGTGSANTDGSINTTKTSASTTSGFSICQYTGTGSAATVGHGLGATPEWLIIKSSSGTEQWVIGNQASGFTKNLHFLTAGLNTSTSIFNDTAPTSSLFTVGTNSGTNGSSQTYMAYCFAPKRGFSSMGSYLGNGNADGTFVHTGFKPAFVLIKSTSSGRDWLLGDNKRLGYNGGNKASIPNGNNAEEALALDYTSSGFKLRTTGNPNVSGETFIFMAFAAAPFVNSSGVPVTAGV